MQQKSVCIVRYIDNGKGAKEAKAIYAELVLASTRWVLVLQEAEQLQSMQGEQEICEGVHAEEVQGRLVFKISKSKKGVFATFQDEWYGDFSGLYKN